MHSVQTTPPLADGSHSIQIYVGAMSILFSERLSRDCNTVFDDFNSFVSSYKVNRSVLVTSHNADSYRYHV